MNTIKTAAKKILRPILKEAAFELIAGRYGDIETLAKCMVSHTFWGSMRRLRTFKDKHKGGRCFIIGNGPSLNKLDLTLLKNEITFGLNRIYLLFDRVGFITTYYVSVNELVIEQSADEIEKLNCPKFIGWNARRHLRFTSDTVFLPSRSSPKFCRDIRTQGIWEGATVTYVAMQLAFYMGFSEVILIGVDHNYTTSGEPHKLVISEDKDPNHFDPDYFGKGFRWNLPDLIMSEKAYAMAKKAYLDSGRKILDATVDGRLTIFPKVRYEEIISNRAVKK